MEPLLENIINFIATQGIWCALFVWLFMSYKKESSEREEKLMTIVDEQSNRLTKISDTLDSINNRLDILEHTRE